MKIILLNDVKKQGKKGDIIDVKDGYGTFLINKKDATLATVNSVNKLNEDNKKQELKELNTIKQMEILKEKLEKLTLKFKVKTGSNDKVFGSISPKQIIESLKNEGYTIDKKQVKLDDSISTLGFHIVEIILHKKVIAKVKVELIK